MDLGDRTSSCVEDGVTSCDNNALFMCTRTCQVNRIVEQIVQSAVTHTRLHKKNYITLYKSEG